MLSDEQKKALRKRLDDAKLSIDHWQILQLFTEGLDPDEIAGALGKTGNNIETYWLRDIRSRLNIPTSKGGLDILRQEFAGLFDVADEPTASEEPEPQPQPEPPHEEPKRNPDGSIEGEFSNERPDEPKAPPRPAKEIHINARKKRRNKQGLDRERFPPGPETGAPWGRWALIAGIPILLVLAGIVGYWIGHTPGGLAAAPAELPRQEGTPSPTGLRTADPGLTQPLTVTAIPATTPTITEIPTAIPTSTNTPTVSPSPTITPIPTNSPVPTPTSKPITPPGSVLDFRSWWYGERLRVFVNAPEDTCITATNGLNCMSHPQAGVGISNIYTEDLKVNYTFSQFYLQLANGTKKWIGAKSFDAFTDAPTDGTLFNIPALHPAEGPTQFLPLSIPSDQLHANGDVFKICLQNGGKGLELACWQNKAAASP